MSPLAGYKVLELSRRPAAAFCARQFAVWGADVVVLEPPGGSPLRRLSPLVEDAQGEPRSLLWSYLAGGKRSVHTPAAEGIGEWLAAADVLVTDWDVASLEALCGPLDGLARAFPGLCLVSISPCGLSGPYAGFHGSDIVTQALSGYMTTNGDRTGPPLRAPGRIAPYAIGVNALVAALAALWRRERTGGGGLVEVSEMESLAAMTPFLRVHYLGGERVRQGGPDAGVRLFRCSDGWVSFHPYAPADMDRVLTALEISPQDVPADLLVGSPLEVNGKAVAFFAPYTRDRSRRDVFQRLEDSGVVCGILYEPSELLEHEQLRARSFYRPLVEPGLPLLHIPGPGVDFTHARPIDPAPAPPPGGPAAPADLGWSAAPETASAGGGALPLEGVRVVDFTQAWIGPFATMLLADLGADVIKIESHRRPDIWRTASPNPLPGVELGGDRLNRSCHFNSVNRSKRELTLDLRAPEGQALALRLIAEADLVADNYTPRVMARFGLDYASLREVKPDIITASGSGFGKTGPWADYKSNGSAIEALAGWDFAHRYPGGDPQLMAFYQPDPICGFHMAAMMLAGLLRRRRTGEGDAFDLSMFEVAIGHVGETILQAQTADSPAAPSANRDPDMSPNGAFPCAGEDRWIAISVPDDAAWVSLQASPRFPTALRHPDFATLQGRRRHEDRLEALLGAWTAGWAGPQLTAELQARGVPAGGVLRWGEATADPHLAARGWFLQLTRPDIGVYAYSGFAWRFAGCPLAPPRPPPRLGEDSREILRDRLNLSEAEIADLEAREITGSVP